MIGRWPVVAVMCVVAVTGCTTGTTGTADRTPTPSSRSDGSSASSSWAASSTAASRRSAQPADKQGDGKLREEASPLTSRFPALGTPIKVRWMSGTLGTSPGPSTYWIDAVVWVTPEVGQQLRASNIVLGEEH